MAEDWCDHCDLPRSYCIHGLPMEVQRGIASASTSSKSRLYREGPTIEASTTSTCPGCGGQVETGDPITLSQRGWAHADEVHEQGGGPTSTSPEVFDDLWGREGKS